MTKIVIDSTFLIGNCLGVYVTKCLILKREKVLRKRFQEHVSAICSQLATWLSGIEFGYHV